MGAQRWGCPVMPPSSDYVKTGGQRVYSVAFLKPHRRVSPPIWKNKMKRAGGNGAAERGLPEETFEQEGERKLRCSVGAGWEGGIRSRSGEARGL